MQTENKRRRRRRDIGNEGDTIITWRWEKNPKDLIDKVGRKYKRSETVRDRD